MWGLFQPGAKKLGAVGQAKEFSWCQPGGASPTTDGFRVYGALLQPGLHPVWKEARKVFCETGAERQVNVRRGIFGHLDVKAFRFHTASFLSLLQNLPQPLVGYVASEQRLGESKSEGRGGKF